MKIRNARIEVKQGYPSVHFEAFLQGQWRGGSIFCELKPTLALHGIVPIRGEAGRFLPPTQIPGTSTSLKSGSSSPEARCLCGLLKEARLKGDIDLADKGTFDRGLDTFKAMQIQARELLQD